MVLTATVWLTSTRLIAQDSTRLPFTANFDSGNLYADFDGFNNGTGVTVESQGCYSGMCLRFPLTAGTLSEAYGEYYFADHVGRNGPKVEEVWVRLWSKFDPGIVWPNRTQKIALLNLTDGVVSTRRYQMMLEVSPSGALLR